MKVLLRLFLVPIMLVFIISCGSNQSADQTSQIEDEDNYEDEFVEGMVELSLAEYGLNILLMVPDENLTGIPVEVVDNQDMGMIEVRAGDKYSFSIALDEADFQLKKDDLETDLLFKNTILEEDSTFLMYRSTLPDESQSFYHFYAGETVSGNTYVIEDLKSGKFSEVNVIQMIKSVKSIRPIRSS